MINTTMGIIGRICSGKSTIAQKLSANFDIPIISFGAYLMQYSKGNNLPTDREALQNLGNAFIKEDSNKFLQNVITAQPVISKTIIIEGIRHLSIQKALTDISKFSIFIFVDASIETRYIRYCNRQKESDKAMSYKEFTTVDNHIVESEIELLKEKCHLTINSESDSLESICNKISKLL